MLSRLFDRSVRWLIASLAIAALVTALAVPVQAAPRSETSTDWMASFVHRVYDLLVDLGFGFDTAPPREDRNGDDEPDVLFMKEGCTADPTGTTCPEND